MSLTEPPDPPRLCIVRRQSPDWGTMSEEEFAAQSRRFYRMLDRPEEQGIEMAGLWDRTFTVSFRQARQAMKDIAAANLRLAQGAVFLDAAADLADFPGERTLCCFVDDDDWMRADGAAVLAEFVAPEFEGYLWRQIRCGRFTGEWLRVAPKLDVCGTNNYAVSAAFLREDPENLARVYQHFAANEVFSALQIRRIDDLTISATNRHPASTMFLERGLAGDFSSGRLVAMVEEYNRRLAEPPARLAAGAAWVLPWVDEVRRFYEELAATRR